MADDNDRRGAIVAGATAALIGGLGVFLALQGVDRFDYQRDNGVNRNTLEVDLP